ncbi:MAG: DUF1013 domain-containing protein, partial [Bifidobacteriales bacterium]|nr:DUF1013 domain-containing protein [Bifidobacteriales bacterium]
SPNIKPRDPVILGLCTQTDLNAAVQAANDRLVREGTVLQDTPHEDDPNRLFATPDESHDGL